MSSTGGVGPQSPLELYEQSEVIWRRDWDALLIGFVFGVLSALAAQSLW